MVILDTFAEIGFYRTGLAIKNIVKIASIIVPIMIIILGMIDIGKITTNPDEAKVQIKKLVDRIIAGLIVLILPTIMNYGFSLIKSYDKNTIFKYYEGASKQKIQQLEAQYKSEQIAQQNKEKAEALQLAKENEAAEAKRRAQQEKDLKKEKNNTTIITTKVIMVVAVTATEETEILEGMVTPEDLVTQEILPLEELMEV